MKRKIQPATRPEDAGTAPPEVPARSAAAPFDQTEDEVFRDPFADFAPSNR
ncbi:MAG TPA: hypothetical protein VMG41_17665 [Gemmatimonadales bacterium]|nr:hypothetical protein [Gemmatimonadales bacterium]